MKPIHLVIIIAIIAIVGGFSFDQYLNHQRDLNNPIIGQSRPSFWINDITGKKRDIEEWKDKLVLINFWATWCEPCKNEIPNFIKLQKKYGNQGFQIIGIAIDDEESVKEYMQQVKFNYPIMAIDTKGMRLATKYGNTEGVLPYSVFINREGIITHTITGELGVEQLTDLLEKQGVKL